MTFLRHSWLPKRQGEDRRQMLKLMEPPSVDSILGNDKEKPWASSPEPYRLSLLEPPDQPALPSDVRNKGKKEMAEKRAFPGVSESLKPPI